MKKEVGYDKRPRFGWADDLDKDPQHVREVKSPRFSQPVAVIPLPFMSSKVRRKIREFVNGSVWPRTIKK